MNEQWIKTMTRRNTMPIRHILTVAITVAGALTLAGTTPAVAGPQHGRTLWCTNNDGGLLYGNREPDGSVRIYGSGWEGLEKVRARPGEDLYKSCTEYGAWVSAPSNRASR